MSVGAIIGGWAWAVWGLVSHRKSAREAKEASDAMMAKLDESIAQNQLLLAKMDAMIGKPAAEQRRIVQEAKEYIGVQDSLEIVLVGSDGKVKEHRRDD